VNAVLLWAPSPIHHSPGGRETRPERRTAAAGAEQGCRRRPLTDIWSFVVNTVITVGVGVITRVSVTGVAEIIGVSKVSTANRCTVFVVAAIFPSV
jgi:hypothetical protein